MTTLRSRRELLRAMAAGAVMLVCCTQAPAASKPAAGGDTQAKPAGSTAPAAPAAPAAAPKADAGAGAKPKRVTFAITTTLEGWSPYTQSGATGYSMWMQVLEPLVHKEFKDGKGVYVPKLAERFETTDGKTWTFYLRKGVKWSDGSEFTAADVVHSWNRIMNDDDSKQQGQLKAYVQSMETPDPYTMRAVLKQPNAVFMDEVRNRVISCKALFDKVGKEQADKNPIGTGPYLFKEWVDGQRFVVTRNPNYWGPKPDVDEVIYRTIPEAEGRITSLLNGEVDIIERIEAQHVQRLQSSSNVKVEAVDGQRHLFLGMRPDMAPTDNLKVRQAIYHAIDRTPLVKNILQGYATELKGPLASFAIGYDPSLPVYEFNPAKAKALLAEGGFPNGVSLDFYVPATQYAKAKEVGEAIVAMLKDVGITANMKTPEWGTFSNDYNTGKYGFYMIGRGNVEDPSAYLVQYFRTGGSKRLGYSNPKVDEWLDKQQGTIDEAERAKQLSEAQKLIMADAPAVFLYAYKDIYAAQNRVDWNPLPNENVLGFDVKVKA
jgi:peptide/nickel transport system substrate-binding protein